MKYEIQASSLPTNKALIAASVTAAASELWPTLMQFAAIQFPAQAALFYPGMAGPAMSGMIGAVIALAIAWFVKDRAGIPTS